MEEKIKDKYEEMIHRVNYHLISNRTNNKIRKNGPKKRILLALKYHKRRLAYRTKMYSGLSDEERKNAGKKYLKIAEQSKGHIDSYIDLLTQSDNSVNEQGKQN